MSGAQSSGLAAATLGRLGEGWAGAAAEAEGSKVIAEVFLSEDSKEAGPGALSTRKLARGGGPSPQEECSCSPGSPCSPRTGAQHSTHPTPPKRPHGAAARWRPPP